MNKLYAFGLKHIKNNKTSRKQLNELNCERETPLKGFELLIRYSDGLRAGWPGFESRQEQDFSLFHSI
jgi:hypothetical protein